MNIPFTLKQLQIIKALADKKNFTRASKILFITQPTISKQIKTLESDLGVTLIKNCNNDLKFTNIGKIFLQYSERILSLCEENFKKITKSKKKYQKSVIFGINIIGNNYLLPRILLLYFINSNKFSIKFCITSSKKIHNYLKQNSINFGIINKKTFIEQKNPIISKKVIIDRLRLIKLQKNPLIKYTTTLITKKNFYKLNFIKLSYNSQIPKLIKKKLSRKNDKKDLKYILKLNSSLARNRAIDLGLGSSLTFSKMNKYNIKLNSKILNNIRVIRPFFFLTNSKSYNSKLSNFLMNNFYI